MATKLTQVMTELGKQLRDKKLTLVTAESCTGGGLAYYISINPQSSAMLERGYVTYSNQSKQELLAVQPFILQTHGAVSKEVAIEMAQGALKNSGAQVSIAITGIAGPDKTENTTAHDKGLVWIACAGFNAKTIAKQKAISGQRDQFIKKVIMAGVKQLLAYISKLDKH